MNLSFHVVPSIDEGHIYIGKSFYKIILLKLHTLHYKGILS